MDFQRFERAIALRDAGREEEALREFEALAGLAIDSREEGSLIANQATCLWRLGRIPEARQRHDRAAILWTNLFVEFVDACLCAAEKKSDEARRKLTLFLENHVDLKGTSDEGIFVDAQEELGRLLYGLGRYQEAVSPLQDALASAQFAQRNRICFYLGVCHYKNEDWEAAKAKLVEVLGADSQDGWWLRAQYYLGICHYKTGNLEAAQKALIASLPNDRQDPLWFEAQYRLGIVYFHRGSYLSAKQAFEVCECFIDDAKRRKNLSGWLAAARVKLGEGGCGATQ